MGNVVQGLRDPLGSALQLLTGVTSHFLATARVDLNNELARYLFSTVDASAAVVRPLTANPSIAKLNFGLTLAADVLVGAVVLVVSLRAIFEHTSLRARYGLKVALPRVLVAVALAHTSMLLIQMAVDLNNAIGHVALTLGGALTLDTLPWSASLGNPAVAGIQASQDLFHAFFGLALVVALVILVLSYVIRSALLNILIVIAPLAALCMVLPETRGYSRTWLRLFMTTVFMQAVQLIVLRVAEATAFSHGGGIVDILYALATLWIMLKVPGALHSGGHFESRAHALGRHMQRSVRHALTPAHHAVHHRVAT